VISTTPSCAHQQHVLPHCTKWLPELKIEKSFSAFTGQTTDHWDFNQTLQEFSVPFLAMDIIGTFRFAAHNGCQS
jgi:hypothetical protein